MQREWQYETVTISIWNIAYVNLPFRNGDWESRRDKLIYRFGDSGYGIFWAYRIINEIPNAYEVSINFLITPENDTPD